MVIRMAVTGVASDRTAYVVTARIKRLYRDPSKHPSAAKALLDVEVGATGVADTEVATREPFASEPQLRPDPLAAETQLSYNCDGRRLLNRQPTRIANA
jgi:hypothetical protein